MSQQSPQEVAGAASESPSAAGLPTVPIEHATLSGIRRSRERPSALDRLRHSPARFSLDQAVAVLTPGCDPVDVPYRTVANLGSPDGEVSLGGKAGDELLTPTFGLIGPGGVLPRHYTAWVASEDRHRSQALHGFLDLLARRFTGLFVKAGDKYRPTRQPRHAQDVLASAIGVGTPHLVEALETPLRALLHHAGTLSSRTRSAERLRGMLSEETGFEVRIIEFAGGWVRLPAAEQTRLSALGGHARVGLGASVGSQVWDPSSRFVIQLGPVPMSTYRMVLPGKGMFRRLVELTRLHCGLEHEFVINPVLPPEEVPPLRLGVAPEGQGPQLGWTSWLNSPRPRHVPCADAMLHPPGP